MGFDFNKLDDYKVALDDGAVFEDDVDMYSEHMNDIVLCIVTVYKKSKDMYFLNIEDYNCNVVVNISENNFETFKKKVADFFLNKN